MKLYPKSRSDEVERLTHLNFQYQLRGRRTVGTPSKGWTDQGHFQI
jgi:hypothetical protein